MAAQVDLLHAVAELADVGRELKAAVAFQEHGAPFDDLPAKELNRYRSCARDSLLNSLLQGIPAQTDSPSRPQRANLSSLRFAIELHSAGMPPVNLCVYGTEELPLRSRLSSDTGIMIIFGRRPASAIRFSIRFCAV